MFSENRVSENRVSENRGGLEPSLGENRKMRRSVTDRTTATQCNFIADRRIPTYPQNLTPNAGSWDGSSRSERIRLATIASLVATVYGRWRTCGNLKVDGLSAKMRLIR